MRYKINYMDGKNDPRLYDSFEEAKRMVEGQTSYFVNEFGYSCYRGVVVLRIDMVKDMNEVCCKEDADVTKLVNILLKEKFTIFGEYVRNTLQGLPCRSVDVIGVSGEWIRNILVLILNSGFSVVLTNEVTDEVDGLKFSAKSFSINGFITLSFVLGVVPNDHCNINQLTLSNDNRQGIGILRGDLVSTLQDLNKKTYTSTKGMTEALRSEMLNLGFRETVI